MMPIQSILDTDLYKLTMQKAVLDRYPGIPVEYSFVNRRREGKFTKEFHDVFQLRLEEMRRLSLQRSEADWLNEHVPELGPTYIEYLRNYRFDPGEVSSNLVDGDLELKIAGTWERTILWEVPLMAMISELYFLYCDKNWKFDAAQQRLQATTKGERLSSRANKGLTFSDFGTRRRRNYATQALIVETLKAYKGFSGTSNVHLAHRFAVPPRGTKAHEWTMGISALEGLRHANRHALRIWAEVFKGRLGIALPDTFGAEAFFQDFDHYLSHLYDGVRHDSADPIIFGKKLICHYERLKIPTMTKRIVFSDGLTADAACSIFDAFAGKIRCDFGIGTHLTNDFSGSPALNMVIKLTKCNGVPVVKLSDMPSKAIGDPDALRVAKWTFFNQPLDS